MKAVVRLLDTGLAAVSTADMELQLAPVRSQLACTCASLQRTEDTLLNSLKEGTAGRRVALRSLCPAFCAHL
jgi:hypothetical protein